MAIEEAQSFVRSGKTSKSKWIRLVLTVRHTRRWYLENFGVDPVKLNLKCESVKNPHFSSAAPMKLWKEEDVLPFKSDDGIRRYGRRKEAGRRAHETRKTRLVEWWKQVKSENLQVQEIVKRLWVIGEEISKLHEEKKKCRGSQDRSQREAHWEFGEEHCQDCAEKTEAQQTLRAERERFFMELERVCEKDKATIQIARRYYRSEQQVNTMSESPSMEA